MLVLWVASHPCWTASLHTLHRSREKVWPGELSAGVGHTDRRKVSVRSGQDYCYFLFFLVSTFLTPALRRFPYSTVSCYRRTAFHKNHTHPHTHTGGENLPSGSPKQKRRITLRKPRDCMLRTWYVYTSRSVVKHLHNSTISNKCMRLYVR